MTPYGIMDTSLSGIRCDLQNLLERLDQNRLNIYVPFETGSRRRPDRSHFHATPELLIQIGGATDFVCPGQSFRVSAGDCCVMPRGVPHAETPIDEKTPYGLLVCMYSPKGQRMHRARSDQTRTIQGYGGHHLEHPLARDAFRHLDALTSFSKAISESRLDSYRQTLLRAFLLATLSVLEMRDFQEDQQSHPSPLVRAAEHNVMTHLGDPNLSVCGIARAIGCSADHLSRQFRKVHKQSLQSWILKQRIDYACELLRDSRFNVAEVGWASGFNDTSYFIRVFRKFQGITPRRYRELY